MRSSASDVESDGLVRGIESDKVQGPTLRSVRRMSNLVKALQEINRRPIGVDGIPYAGWVNPREYALWDRNFLDTYGLEPLKTLQEGLSYGEMPDATRETPVKNRVVERGTVRNSIVERAITRKLQLNLDRCFANSSWAYRPGRSPEKAIREVRTCIRRGAHWALKTDIRHFFPNVDRRILAIQLHDTIRDPLLWDSIVTAISPCLRHLDGSIISQRTGLPQGMESALSSPTFICTAPIWLAPHCSISAMQTTF